MKSYVPKKGLQRGADLTSDGGAREQSISREGPVGPGSYDVQAGVKLSFGKHAPQVRLNK